MTPLAAQMFRQAIYEGVQQGLASAQFFECTALYAMAKDMVAGDLASGSSSYSECAQLPAPTTAIEFRTDQGPILVVAGLAAVPDGHPDQIQYMVFTEFDGEVRFCFECGFCPGTNHNCHAEWDAGVLRALARQVDADPTTFGTTQATGLNGIIEKMLVMINQPGLVDRRTRDTDKRVVRKAAAASLAAPPKWHQCRIRPGVHGSASDKSDGEHREHQLHYVRKYFKPSLGRWIEGYWRGNADLGIHLKWYSVQPPVGSA